MTKTFQERAWDASREVLEPSSRQTIAPAIYDELKMSAGITGVVFNHVVILTGFIIKNNTATGTIIVPEGTTTIELAGSQVNVLYWSWRQICEHFGA